MSGSSPTIPVPPYVTSPPSRSIAPPAFGRRLRFDTDAVGRNDDAHTAGLPAASGSSPTIVAPEYETSDEPESSRSEFAPRFNAPPVTAIPPATLLKSSAAIWPSVYASASDFAVAMFVVTVDAKLASSFRAAASSFRVSNTPGAESTRPATAVSVYAFAVETASDSAVSAYDCSDVVAVATIPSAYVLASASAVSAYDSACAIASALAVSALVVASAAAAASAACFCVSTLAFVDRFSPFTLTGTVNAAPPPDSASL